MQKSDQIIRKIVDYVKTDLKSDKKSYKTFENSIKVEEK